MKRALVDRHHAGLFYSLQLLFDRLDCEVWTPIGYDWWDEGYWRFGEKHLGQQLANQYLDPADAQWATYDFGFTFETYDPEFPQRRIDAATLATAREMSWDYVVATLQDNQQGFARFAREVGAKYVLQVGNTGQQIDWSLDPLVLNSSEMPLLGRGVRYHQEMDPHAFRWRDPAESEPNIVSSFVNCMPGIACWPLVVDFWRRSRADVRIYGIDGPSGVVKPATRLGDLMAKSAWGWHDKVHGDGFGHVLHGWAAVGRPIIGHASHYAGKLGEVFWQDGVTCIDLDKHSVEEAIAIIRDTTPERHREMCRAIRTRFDAAVDHEADADRIRALLGGR